MRVEQGQVGGLEAVAFLHPRAIDAQLAPLIVDGRAHVGRIGSNRNRLGRSEVLVHERRDDVARRSRRVAVRVADGHVGGEGHAVGNRHLGTGLSTRDLLRRAVDRHDRLAPSGAAGATQGPGDGQQSSVTIALLDRVAARDSRLIGADARGRRDRLSAGRCRGVTVGVARDDRHRVVLAVAQARDGARRRTGRAAAAGRAVSGRRGDRVAGDRRAVVGGRGPRHVDRGVSGRR